MTRTLAPPCLAALVLGCTWFQPQPPPPEQTPTCNCPLPPQPAEPPPLPPPQPSSTLRVFGSDGLPLGTAYAATPEQVTVLETQSDGVSRLVSRSVNEGTGAARLPDFQYETTDCSGPRWVPGRLSPSFAYPQPSTGEVLASPRDGGYGFAPSATFFSTSSTLSDGGTACVHYDSCTPNPDGGEDVCTPLTRTAPATRVEVVGVDRPPAPPLLISP